MDEKINQFVDVLQSCLKTPMASSVALHDLRVKSRELYTLLYKNSSFASKVKKILKYSNVLRDLDVFEETYLVNLPKKYQKRLPMIYIKQELQKQRLNEQKKFYLYLDSFRVPQEIPWLDRDTKIKDELPQIPVLKQKKLHKYRILLKHRLFLEKNSFPVNNNEVRRLTKIKDLLGTINDNFNAMIRLERYIGNTKLFKRIKNNTKKKNKRLYQTLLEKIQYA